MIYFDNSATSKYKPKVAQKALINEFKNSANGGRSSHNDALLTALKISDARTFLCQKLNANEVIFTKNCTEALNIVIFSVLKSGHCITTVNEHNSVLRPLYKLKKDNNIDLTILNPNECDLINPLHIEKSIKEDTKLVVINAVSNVTGQVQNIDEIGNICKKYNVPLLVDGAQALPHISFNLKKQNISYLAVAGHKGLHGPQGTGFLALNNVNIEPLLYGGTGINSDSVYMSRMLPESLEAGTLNSLGIISLYESAKWTYKNLDKINGKIAKISSYILNSLKDIKNIQLYTPQGLTTGVISFNIVGYDSSEIANILNKKYGIAVRGGLHCAPLIHNFLGTLERGAVRVSVGYNNSIKDAKKLIEAIKQLSV